MSSSFFFFYHLVLLLIFIHKHRINSIPACIIIDTNMINRPTSETLPNNRSSSSLLLRNLRMLDHQRSSGLPELFVEPIPLTYIDIKETSSLSPLITKNHSSMKKSLTNSIVDQTFSPCSVNLLNEIETQMVVPFEFRRLRIEQPDHRTKYLDDDLRQTVPDLSTVVYERRSDPEGLRFCRTCRDGKKSF
jgi:hypothetical protein